MSQLSTVASECRSFSLTQGSWSSYDTAMHNAARAEQATGCHIRPPFSPQMISTFALFMLSERKVQPQTVSNNISGLAKWSALAGYPVPNLKDDYTAAILGGMNNKRKALLDAGILPRRSRRAITLSHLQFFGAWLLSSRFSPFNRQLLWTLATVSFFGSFRIGELISKSSTSFDAAFTLLVKDIVFSSFTDKQSGNKVKTASFLIKSPKILRVSRGDRVVLYSLTKDDGSPHPLCPLAALSKFVNMLSNKNMLELDCPFFRLESGNCLSHTRFNSILRDAFAPFTSPTESFSAHSFRKGVSSHMEEWGFSEDEIKVSSFARSSFSPSLPFVFPRAKVVGVPNVGNYTAIFQLTDAG